MEIEVIKGNGKNEQTYSLKIIDYSKVIETKSLLLVREDYIEGNDKKKHLNLFINKIQFIGACKTAEVANDILIAFYLKEYGVLAGYIISELPNPYQSYPGYLIDYEAYCDICKLTGEKPQSFYEYFNLVKAGVLNINSLVNVGEEVLNYDNQ